MGNPEFPAPEEGMVLTTLLIVEDQDRSRDFYTKVLGAEVVMERDPVILQFHNSWIIINVGGGPTEDKPDVEMVTPQDPSVGLPPGRTPSWEWANQMSAVRAASPGRSLRRSYQVSPTVPCLLTPAWPAKLRPTNW